MAQGRPRPRPRPRAAGGDHGGGEPTAETAGRQPGLTEDGAGRKGPVSVQLISRLPVPLPRGGVAPSRAAVPPSSRPPPGSDEEEEQEEEDREAPLAAMLSVFRSIPTQMDYKGQKLAEQIFQGIILVSAIIGFIYGYITEQFGWTVYIVMAGFALSCLLTLPPWPMYRRNPLKWLPVQESGTEEKKPADRKPKRHAKS
ncbi:signal peptidase complex subunit 1 [Opisthocomus hoazin]|uniref:signal peptidase complex subunit 1 n=1 Tax=Opisthocomus hoazin TaxID=30419 RepID=UPI003F52F89B